MNDDPDDNENSDETESEGVSLYAHRETGMVFQVKFFDNFVILRLASVAEYAPIMRMPFSVFVGQFEEFYGDREIAEQWLDGGSGDDLPIFGH